MKLPEIWLPTCTFTTGLIVPVAVTACVIEPLVTSALVLRRFSATTASQGQEHDEEADEADADKGDSIHGKTLSPERRSCLDRAHGD